MLGCMKIEVLWIGSIYLSASVYVSFMSSVECGTTEIKLASHKLKCFQVSTYKCIPFRSY